MSKTRSLVDISTTGTINSYIAQNLHGLIGAIAVLSPELPIWELGDVLIEEKAKPEKLKQLEHICRMYRVVIFEEPVPNHILSSEMDIECILIPPYYIIKPTI